MPASMRRCATNLTSSRLRSYSSHADTPANVTVPVVRHTAQLCGGAVAGAASARRPCSILPLGFPTVPGRKKNSLFDRLWSSGALISRSRKIWPGSLGGEREEGKGKRKEGEKRRGKCESQVDLKFGGGVLQKKAAFYCKCKAML